MTPMNVVLVSDKDKGIWSDIRTTDDIIDCGLMEDVAVLEKGMASGLPSVMFRIKLPDGKSVIAQQTARQMVTLAKIIMSRYPDLMD